MIHLRSLASTLRIDLKRPELQALIQPRAVFGLPRFGRQKRPGLSVPLVLLSRRFRIGRGQWLQSLCADRGLRRQIFNSQAVFLQISSFRAALQACSSIKLRLDCIGNLCHLPLISVWSSKVFGAKSSF